MSGAALPVTFYGQGESPCGESGCVGGTITLGDRNHPCPECVRLGLIDRATWAAR